MCLWVCVLVMASSGRLCVGSDVITSMLVLAVTGSGVVNIGSVVFPCLC